MLRGRLVDIQNGSDAVLSPLSVTWLSLIRWKYAIKATRRVAVVQRGNDRRRGSCTIMIRMLWLYLPRSPKESHSFHNIFLCSD